MTIDPSIVPGLLLPTTASVPVYPGFGGPAAAQWFAGDMASWQGTQHQTYEFDPRVPSLVGRTEDGSAGEAGASGGTPLGPGRWTLVLRLIRAVDHVTYVAQEPVAFIPVMHMEVSESGEVSYEVYEGDLNAKLRPIP